jgi:hypothetical protein
MDQYTNKIKLMTFEELRNELSLTDGNQIKELIIRKMMKKKYYKYKNKKKLLKNMENEEIEIVDYLINDINDQKRSNSIMDIIDDDIQLFDQQINENHDKLDNNHGPLNELDPRARMYDKKFSEEIEKDGINNNLMSRLNSDIFINKTSKQVRKKFDSPFSNNADNKYASFHQPKNIPNNDFGNIRFK